MSTPTSAIEFQIIAYGSLICAFIASIGLLTLCDYFKQHNVPYKQVKIFALLSHISLIMMNLNGGITMNSAAFSQFHQNYEIISDLNCKYMLMTISVCNFLAKYFMNAFSLSRLRYFFDSPSMALNAKIYYGWLILYAIFSFSLLIYIFIDLNAFVLTAIDDDKISKCHPDSNAMKIFIFHFVVVDGFMQCILLYLYYKKYRQFRSIYHIENIDDKYVKKHVVKRSLLLGMIAIVTTWICGPMIMKSTLFSVIGVVLSLIIQISAIIFSFNIKCCSEDIDNNQLIEFGNVDIGGNALSEESEEYLARIMAAYYQKPQQSN